MNTSLFTYVLRIIEKLSVAQVKFNIVFYSPLNIITHYSMQLKKQPSAQGLSEYNKRGWNLIVPASFYNFLSLVRRVDSHFTVG